MLIKLYQELHNLLHGALLADSDVSGVLRFEGRDYELTLLNLPTVTESYKTYDDINLVKTGDIGQVLVVGDISEEEANTGEISDGVTMPLRKARSRIFRKATPVSPEAVARVESQILDVLSVGLEGCIIYEPNTILLQIAKSLPT